MKQLLGTFEKLDVLLAIFFLVFLLSSFKYFADGESYIFETPLNSTNIILNDDNIVTQDIIVENRTEWNRKSYAVYLEFDVDNHKINDRKGVLCVELVQGDDLLDESQIPTAWLMSGFNELKWIDFSKLKPGNARIKIWAKNLNFDVRLGTAKNIYNLPNCFVNGNDTGSTLVQRYHYTYNNNEFKLGIILFCLLVLVTFFSYYLILKGLSNKYNWILRMNLILTFMVLIYGYDSSLYFQPTWAEAVTNFMHNSVTSQFSLGTLLITDAGYLPFFQRLISVIVFNVLNIDAYWGLFVIQIIAFLIAALIFSFFIRSEFDDILGIEFRYVLCLVIMTYIIDKETGAFINFITYGSLIIFLFYLVDSEKWDRKTYLTICAFGFVACLSKGAYVTMLPFVLLCLIIFRKTFSKRDYVFSLCIALGAFIQLVYYLQIGSDWVDRNKTSCTEQYYLKLIFHMLIDTPNRLLSWFSGQIAIFNGITYLIVIIFWIAFIMGFIKCIIYKWINRQEITHMVKVVYMMIIYVMAQSLFLRITIYGVSSSDIVSDDFWLFSDVDVYNRHQDMIFMAVFILVIVGLNVLCTKIEKKQFGYILVGLFTIVSMVNIRWQIKGLGTDRYAQSTYISELASEYTLFEGLEYATCRMIPIQPNGWIYMKNANAVCLGSDFYGYGFSRIESDEPSTGEIKLSNYPNIDITVPIYQVFVTKKCLVNSNPYKIILYGEDGAKIMEKKQDNITRQKLTSFTLDFPVANCAAIQIVDSSGKQVHLENDLYIVTSQSDSSYVIR